MFLQLHDLHGQFHVININQIARIGNVNTYKINGEAIETVQVVVGPDVITYPANVLFTAMNAMGATLAVGSDLIAAAGMTETTDVSDTDYVDDTALAEEDPVTMTSFEEYHS